MADDLLDRLRARLSDRYVLEQEIGRGGLGAIFLADDVRRGGRVAIKVLHPKVGASLDTGRFLGQMQVASTLEHPRILQVLDLGEADGLPFFVMPYAEGADLRTRLEREKRLPLEEASRIACEVADGLDYAHRQGVVHRDLKPENILFREGHAVIGDFGLARGVEEARPEGDAAEHILVGSPAYMSPEQATGRPVDGRADVYALGCVLFEMLTGEPPLTARSEQKTVSRRQQETPTPVQLFRPSVAGGVDEVLRRALDPVPVERYGTAQEFAQQLASAVLEPSSPRFAARRADTAWPSLDRRVRRAAFPIAFVVVVLILALLAWFLSSA